MPQIFGSACINPVLWESEDVAPNSVDNGVYTYVLTQPLPPIGWRGMCCVVVFLRAD